MSTIFVSGAPGNIGTELVRLLSERGHAVKAFVHHPEKAGLVAFPGVEVIVGDLSERNKLESAISGTDCVFVNISASPQMVGLQNNLIDAAKSAGAKHIVKHSVIDADEGSDIQYISWHGQIERHLMDSGVPYTIVRSNTLMQNSLAQAEAISTQGAFYGAGGDHRVSIVDARDTASVAATVLTESGHEGKTYLATGAEAQSDPEMAGIISEVIGRLVRYVQLTPQQLEESLKTRGVPDWMAADLRKGAEEWTASREQLTDVVEKVGGKRPRSFAEFVSEHRQTFNPVTTVMRAK